MGTLSFEEEVLRRLDAILTHLGLTLQDPMATPRTVEPTPKKGSVADPLYFKVGGAILRVLLRDGNRTTGKRAPELATEVGGSKDTVRRVVERMAKEENGIVTRIALSGRGGKGTIIRISGRRYEEASALAVKLETASKKDSK